MKLLTLLKEKILKLPPEERELIKTLLIKFQDDPKSLIQLYSELEGYKEPPVDIITFIENEKYLGLSLKGRIYPIWKKALRKIFPNPFYSPYYEVIFKGAIGIGKTTIARIIQLYNLYKLLLLKDPHKKFNLIPTDKIVIALFNATLGLADQVLYEPFKQLISNSEFFTDNLEPDNKKTSEILFKNKIGIVVGSRFTHTLGMAVFGGMLDEANFDVINEQAKNSYTALVRRMESRFAQAGGKLPGHICLISSEKSPTDFVSQHAEKVKHNPNVKIFSYPIWEVKKHLNIYSGKTFKVFVGDETTDPFIIESEEDYKKIPEDKQDKVIDVPIELKDKFEIDIHNAIRDLAGISVGSTHRLFRSKKILIQQASVSNIITKEIIRLPFNSDDRLINYINSGYIANLPYKDKLRFIHIDLAITGDRVGIASTYLKGYKEVERINPITLKKSVVREPELITEFVMYIEPLPGDRIPFYKIREFILNLFQSGYPIGSVSTDGFQSEDMRQQLTLAGFKTKLISVDKKKDPYLSFRDALYEKRAWIPNHPLLIKELVHIEDIGKKIDHPPEFPDGSKGSKDGADAVVGSFWNCITDERINSFNHFKAILDVEDSNSPTEITNLFWS